MFGRPISTRNDDGETPRALSGWRAKVKAALEAAVAGATKGRGFTLLTDLVELQICWLSVNPKDRSQPDIDNMLKPLIDVLNKTVIDDDRQVHRIIAEKADINFPPKMVEDVIDAIRFEDDYVLGEVIVVRVVPFSAGDNR